MSPDFYNWDSQDYAKHSAAQYQWASELIDKLEFSGKESLLDIGCGNGTISALLAKKLPKGLVVGIDNSEPMIMSAKQNFSNAAYPNLKFYVMDAAELDFNDEFDVAFSNASLHWIKDHLSVLKGVKRSLKKSGSFLFQMGGKGNAKDVIDVLNQLINTTPWKPYFQNFVFPYGFYGIDEYKHWIREAGLKQIRLELIPKDMKQNGKEGLAGWIRTTWLPYTERIPSQLRNAFITEIVESYVERFPIDREGHVHVKMKRLEVEGINP
ncbi:MAG: methyltransferase domain-containing protein [Desulfobacterales bacterium]|jgi:trans-aconitate methyltransferase